MRFSVKKWAIIAFTILCAIPLSAKTRWSSNRTIPDADFIGSGELIVGYDGFLNTDSDNQIYAISQVPVSIGIGEWLTVSSGWSNGITAGFKARILNEFAPAVPSLAIGVRNLYHNVSLTRGQVVNDNPEFTGELFLAASKGFDLITTRFHGGVLSIPYSETEQLNGFFGIEKYFGGSFYLTFEGFSFYDRLNLSLFGTLRFLKNDRGEIYAGIIDLERALFNKSGDLEMSLDPDFDTDPVKPGVSVGFNIDFSLPFGKQTQFRTIENLYLEQNRELTELRESHNNLTAQVENEKYRVDTLSIEVDSIETAIAGQDPAPPHYEEIYVRLLAYRAKYDGKPFDPEGLRKIQDEIFAFELDAETALCRIVRKGDSNSAIERDAVVLLGMMKSQKSVPILLERLGDEKDRRMKIALISSLGTIGDQSASYALQHLANSSDQSVAVAAREVLASWGLKVSIDEDAHPTEHVTTEKKEIDTTESAHSQPAVKSAEVHHEEKKSKQVNHK